MFLLMHSPTPMPCHPRLAYCAGLGFLSWYMLGQLRAYSGPQHVWRLIVGLVPILAAVAVAVTRVTDYWHHWSDAAAGSILGFVVSYVFYRQQYPAFSHEQSQLPNRMLRSKSARDLPL